MSIDSVQAERPTWAHDAMTDDDIEFMQGYSDAVGWIPTAKTQELADFVFLSCDGRVWFEMDETHGLAKYKGWTADPGEEILGISAAKFDEHGTEIGYTAGINAALRIYRPEVVREAHAAEAKFRAEMAAMDDAN